jgi:hypothetical protein
MSTETTTVETADLDLDAILNPGADSIMIPQEKKNNLFDRGNPDISFIDKAPVADPPVPELGPDGKPIVAAAAPTITPEELTAIISDNDDSKATGRPKLDKDGLVELANKLIEKKILTPFEDDKPISEYTLKDFEELFEANVEDRERKLREEVPSQFYESLPGELQYAAKYLADGGTDLKGLFRTLAVVEEVKSLDPKNESDQRSIIRSYFQATNFGNPEEIEEEINAWDDRGELEAKALKFKPKLDELTEKQVQYQVHQQEQLRKQQTVQAQLYMDNVYKTLEPAELNGLKLDKKTQNILFAGLVQPNYQSVSGKQTNLLGHLLEKYQFVEPNHALVAEALWLLADPDGYKNKVREVTKKEVVVDTVRKLKSEESKKIASHVEDDDPAAAKRTPGIPRPNQNFFKR